MKKLLALVLALVMTLSLATVGTNAAFKDDAKINPNYDVAVQVLNGMGVFQGYTDGEFKPLNDITRAEVAAIVYRIYTGDVADKQASIYAGYGKFNDVNTAAWYAGYVGYCTNAAFIKGYGDGKFGPNDKVTGYQALAMILRAVGYGKNGEFEGKDWELHVAQVAQQIGALVNVKGELLKAPASRQLVAELLFQCTKAAQVAYTPALGYQVSTAVLNRNGRDKVVYDGVHTTSLGYENFGLVCGDTAHNKWGRPSYSWYDYRDKTGKTVYATFSSTPLKSYTTPVAECDVAADLGLKEDTEIARLTVNGNIVKTANMKNFFNGNDAINVLATKNTIGEQGRLTEIYETDDGLEVVMIDTFLAYVTDVTEVKYDRNKHISANAELSLTVFDKYGADNEEFTDVVLTSTSNWEYEEGDWLLLYARTTDETAKEVMSNLKVYDILGEAESMKGVQTKFSNKAVHIVDNKTYDDAHQFNLDQAGKTSAQYIWFFDTYGNLIGAVEPATDTNYGVISQIRWVDSYGDDNGAARAKVTYIDGNTETVTIYSIKLANGKTNVLSPIGSTNANYNKGVVSTSKQYNAAYENKALYRITESKKGLLLEETTELGKTAPEETYTVKGEATIEPGVAVATKTTKYLVWTGSEYETYTGYKNVPSYAATSEEGVYWAAELSDKDTTAEYVFINAKKANTKDTVTFFVDWDEKVTVTTDLEDGYYTISGGYVNGKLADLYVPVDEDDTTFADNDVIEDLLDTDNIVKVNNHKAIVYGTGILKIVDLTNDLAVNVTDVTTEAKPVGGENSKVFAVEVEDKFDSAVAGTTSATTLDNGAYVVADEAAVVNEATDLEAIDKIVKDYQKNEKSAAKYGKVFVVYTASKSGREQLVSEVYIASPIEEEEEPTPVAKPAKVTFTSAETSILNTKNVVINDEAQEVNGSMVFKVKAGDKAYTFKVDPDEVTVGNKTVKPQVTMISETDNLWEISGLVADQNYTVTVTIKN